MAEFIRIVPWNNPFIPALAKHLAEFWESGPENILVVFPNDRPRRYLKQALAKLPNLPRPTLLPNMLGVEDLFASLAIKLRPSPIHRAQRLDLCSLLYEIISDLHTNGSGLLTKLPLTRLGFFPWGLRLASLLEEFLRHGLTPPDLNQPQNEVEPFAVAILEQLGQIFTSYINSLNERDWTTPGLDCRLICERLEQVLSIMDKKIVVLAGHYALSRTENTLFRAFWEHGALVFWHTDPALAQGNAGHWCTAEHYYCLASWGAQAILVEEPQTRTMPTLRFYKGFDLHSQLTALKKELAEAPGNTTVVLPDVEALIPVLHCLPERDINISMGYPLKRSTIFQLLETLLTLQENRTDQGYLWRDVIACICHPYIKMLEIAETQPLRVISHKWEQRIHAGRKYIELNSLPLEFNLDLDPEVLRQAQGLVQEILTRCFKAFETPRTLMELAQALDGLARLLHERGTYIWKHHLLDAECLFRLFNHITPALAHNTISHKAYPRNLLFFILRQLCSEERISFESELLTGLQVMGVLETRLIHFEKVCVLDAVEQYLPGQSLADPLLPDSLRLFLGLSDSRQRDTVSGYNFHRLIRGAKEAVLFYKTEVTPGILEGKSVRSRFLEELLWSLEQERGALINISDQPPLLNASFHLGPIPRRVLSIKKNAAVHGQLIQQLISQGLSPSRLDDYIACPKFFFFRVLTDLRSLNIVDEGNTFRAFGSLMHKVLEQFLTPHIGQTLRLCDLNFDDLGKNFIQYVENSPELASISLDQRLALGLAGRHRLMTYLRSKKNNTTLLALENDVKVYVKVEGFNIPLRGILDRIDLRDGALLVLDYKTSPNLPRPQSGVWQNETLWSRLTFWDPSQDKGTEVLDELANALPKVQLPLYFWLANQWLGDRNKLTQFSLHNAGWIKLADKGQEILLFDQDANNDLQTMVLQKRIPILIELLIRHILLTPDFMPKIGPRCAYCNFRKPCGV